MGILAGESVLLKDISVALTVAAADCSSINYLIIGIIPSGDVPLVDSVITDNYRALPLKLICKGL